MSAEPPAPEEALPAAGMPAAQDLPPPAGPLAPEAAPAATASSAPHDLPPGAASSPLRDVLINLGAAARLLALRPVSVARWRTGGVALLGLFALRLLIGLLYDLQATGAGGRFDAQALPATSFWALAALAAAWCLALLARRRDLAPALASAGFALACWQGFAASLLALAADRVAWIDRAYDAASWLPLVWTGLAYAQAVARAASMPGRARALLFCAALAWSVLPQSAVDPEARLWSDAATEERGAATGPGAAQSEQSFYTQADLLDDALDAVAEGEEGVGELFFIGFAGDGGQDVFLNEVEGAREILGQVFASAERSVVLANSVAQPQLRPFATATALQRALATMRERMNGDEDVLALVLSSHGTPDHRLVVSLPPYEFDDLTPQRLRTLLDASGIRNRVIIVSSCYAGGFIAPLEGPDTVVIAASAADRTSFGCRDGAQWTDFGRAFFAEGLARSASFEGAFDIARRSIARREAAEGVAASSPQIAVGARIRDRLQHLETGRGGRILFAALRPGAAPNLHREPRWP